MNTSFTVSPIVDFSKKLGALGRVGGGIFAQTGLFGDRFGAWGDARADHNALLHSIWPISIAVNTSFTVVTL